MDKVTVKDTHCEYGTFMFKEARSHKGEGHDAADSAGCAGSLVPAKFALSGLSHGTMCAIEVLESFIVTEEVPCPDMCASAEVVAAGIETIAFASGNEDACVSEVTEACHDIDPHDSLAKHDDFLKYYATFLESFVDAAERVKESVRTVYCVSGRLGML